METSFGTKKRNDGYSTKRLREILGIKQEDLADKLGLSQQAVSKLEQKEIIEDDVLEKIAIALKIPVESIKGFSEEATFNIVANTFNDTFNENSAFISYYPTFNPIDKVIELYERMLQTEKEKVALLEEILKGKK